MISLIYLTSTDTDGNETGSCIGEVMYYEPVAVVDYVPAEIIKKYYEIPKYIFGQRVIYGWIWNKRFKEYTLVMKYWLVRSITQIKKTFLKLRRQFYWSGFCSENRGRHWDCKRR
jgi:hypothetical protein